MTNEKKRDQILESIESLAKQYKKIHVKDLLDQERISSFQVTTDKLSFDYSKQRVTQTVLEELLLIPDKINLRSAMYKISKGVSLNATEESRASHMLHRGINNSEDAPEFIDISKQIIILKEFIEGIQKRSEDHIDTVISIGIGGSRLGPELLSEVYRNTNSTIRVYYCSSNDLIELQDAMSVSSPENTMVVISSKSFDTPEILKNATHAKDWLHDAMGKSCWNNICGISSNKKSMSDFGIKAANQFEILNSIGGRYSIWSSMCLPAIFDMGWSNFEQFKEGASEADQHFIKAPWSKNIPVMMALLNCWNTNGLKINNLGIFTYDFKIRSLTKYLSQMGMESNGKSFNNQNNKSQFNTCPLIWGGYGPEAQHSVFQWLLQGTDYSACDFIGIKEKAEVISSSYQMMLAQITALSLGKENEQYLHQNVQGNNPTSLLVMNDLSPKSLGFLIACYEHKVFVESQIYGINPFDQWGVQLAKRLAEESNRKKDLMKNFFGNKFLT